MVVFFLSVLLCVNAYLRSTSGLLFARAKSKVSAISKVPISWNYLLAHRRQTLIILYSLTAEKEYVDQ